MSILKITCFSYNSVTKNFERVKNVFRQTRYSSDMFFTRCWGTTSATAKSISHLIVDESSLSSDLENVMLVKLQVPQGEILKFIPVESLAVGNEMTTPDFFFHRKVC